MNSDVQVVEDMDQSPPVQFQHKPIGTLSDSDIQGEMTCSDDISNTPATSIPANQQDLGNHNKTSTITETALNMIPEARSQLHYRSNNQMNSYLPAGRRYSNVPFPPYSITSAAQSMSNYEALYGSRNILRSSNEHKTYTPYVSQDTHSYVGRYCPPSMVAGTTIYARNFYPSANEHFRNEQLTGRMAYDRRFHNRVGTETSASVLGGI